MKKKLHVQFVQANGDGPKGNEPLQSGSRQETHDPAFAQPKRRCREAWRLITNRDKARCNFLGCRRSTADAIGNRPTQIFAQS